MPWNQIAPTASHFYFLDRNQWRELASIFQQERNRILFNQALDRREQTVAVTALDSCETRIYQFVNVEQS